MKIAIVHDYIKEYGGAERVLEELIKIFPEADIYTSLFAPEYLGPHRKRFEKYNIKTTWLNSIPFKGKLISPLRILAPLVFRSLDLRSYDKVIVSQTGAYFPNLVKHKKGALFCYTHTPPRYLYGYTTARKVTNPIAKALSSIAFHFLRMVDFRASENVDQFMANSQEVKARIEKFYRRDAVVVYPPVEIGIKSQESGIKKKEEYYLTGGRLARAKGTDIIIDAFIKNGLPLKIFGRGFAGFQKELEERIKNYESRIEFLGEVDDSQKFDLMSQAKAFVFASYDEDFGITPVESMGVGIPVIAYKSGGVKETVVEGVSGVFYDKNTPESLNKALERFKTMKFDRKKIVEQAEKFSAKEFDKKIKEIVNA